LREQFHHDPYDNLHHEPDHYLGFAVIGLAIGWRWRSADSSTGHGEAED
jgi:hypothetical protein